MIETMSCGISERVRRRKGHGGRDRAGQSLRGWRQGTNGSSLYRHNYINSLFHKMRHNMVKNMPARQFREQSHLHDATRLPARPVYLFLQTV